MSARLRMTHVPVVLVLVLLLVWQCVFAVKVMIADALDFSVQRDVVYWGVKGKIPTREEIDNARSQMTRVLAMWPLHPDYLALQARLYAWQGQIATTRLAANSQFKLAITTLRQSLLQRPGNPYSWAQYAEYLATQRDKRLELYSAVDKVKTLGAGDQALQQRMQALAGLTGPAVKVSGSAVEP